MKNRKSRHPIWYGKLVFTLLIMVVYLIGRSIPLYGIDTSAYKNSVLSVENILMQAIGGDQNRSSLFALGVSPHIISSIGLQIILAFLGKDVQKQFSAKRKNAISSKVMLIIALVQAVSNLRHLNFACTGVELYISYMVAVIEMVTGTFVILWLAGRNKKYGIGGQTLFILINIMDGIRLVLSQHELEKLILPGMISLIVIVIIVFMDNLEIHIPVQRISIYNIYADQNYIAFKFIPIGVMPVMYASALFTVPTMIVSVLEMLFP